MVSLRLVDSLFSSRTNTEAASSIDNNAVKSIIEMTSERAYWYLQRKNAEGKLAQLYKELKRCKTGSDFHSTTELLDIHAKAHDLEKAKISQRITNLDDKLANATNELLSMLETAAQSKHSHSNGRHDPTPPPSETSSDTHHSLDDKLAQFRESFETVITNQFAEQSQKLQNDIKDTYEARTATIQNHAHQESQRLNQMQLKLEATIRKQVTEESHKLASKLKDKYEMRIATLEHDLSQHKDSSKKLESKMKDNYETRIATLEHSLSQEKDSSKNLKMVLEKMMSRQESMEKNMRDLSRETTASQNLLQTEMEDANLRLTTVKQTMQLLSQEKDLPKNLQIEMSNANLRLTTIEKRTAEEQAEISSRLDQAAKNEALIALESRLAKCESSQIVANAARKNATEGCKADTNPNDARLQKIDPTASRGQFLELETALGIKMTQWFQQNETGMMSEEKVRHLVQPLILDAQAKLQNKLQDQLKLISERFGSLLDRERQKWTNISVQAQHAAETASTATETVETVKRVLDELKNTDDIMKADLIEFKAESDTVKTDLATLKITSAAIGDSTEETLKVHGVELQKLVAHLASANEKNDSRGDKLEKLVEALWLRTTNMHSWQANFSTIKLFEAIVQHLNSSFMQEHMASILDLRSKIANIESHFADGGNKKRKASDQGPFPSPSFIRR